MEVCPPNKQQNSMAAAQQLQTAVCPGRPCKYDGFPNARAQREFHTKVGNMGASVAKTYFDNLMDREETIKKSVAAMGVELETFGKFIHTLSTEKQKSRDQLEKSRADSMKSLRVIKAKTTYMASLDPIPQ
jgi:hypothetical protein